MIRNFRRRRLDRTERLARSAAGMAACHPERLTAKPEKGLVPQFSLWDAELRQDGLDTGRIIQDFRRGTA